MEVESRNTGKRNAELQWYLAWIVVVFPHVVCCCCRIMPVQQYAYCRYQMRRVQVLVRGHDSNTFPRELLRRMIAQRHFARVHPPGNVCLTPSCARNAGWLCTREQYWIGACECFFDEMQEKKCKAEVVDFRELNMFVFAWLCGLISHNRMPNYVTFWCQIRLEQITQQDFSFSCMRILRKYDTRDGCHAGLLDSWGVTDFEYCIPFSDSTITLEDIRVGCVPGCLFALLLAVYSDLFWCILAFIVICWQNTRGLQYRML